MAGGVFNLSVLDARPGALVFRATGKGSKEAFSREAGGHRWQRVPKNDKRGRVHSSSVTVAVLEELSECEMNLDPGDIDFKTCRGSGAGGQHRNRTESAVQLTHIPTGLQVRCEGERSQHQNRATAMAILRARLRERERTRARTKRDHKRKHQVGSGQRGDKVRTVAVQRDQVICHATGKKIPFKRYRAGYIEDLF